MTNKQIWIDVRGKIKTDLFDFIVNRNFNIIVVKAIELKEIKIMKPIQLVVEVTDSEQLIEMNTEHIVMSENNEILELAKKHGNKTALYSYIYDAESMEKSWKIGLRYDYLVVDFKDITNIPLELLIARLQGEKTNILKKVNNIDNVKILDGVMEIGSDGILFDSNNPGELIEVNNYMEKQNYFKLNMEKAVVTRVQHMGKGYRACLDTTTILGKNEGMIIGSTAQGGLLVVSETHYLPYMNTRPFRVNAGALHSYIWIPGEMTSYLTELESGKSVLAVDSKGNAREVWLGRIKTEIRPLIKIEADIGGKIVNTILQDDWHIRIMGADGEIVNVSNICVGTELLGYVSMGARHVGISIKEHINEK